MACPVRTYPLRQPKNYTPPVPRWQIQLPADLDCVYTIYIGIQQHSSTITGEKDAATAALYIHNFLSKNPPASIETFSVLAGDDILGSCVWVCYYSDVVVYESSLTKLSLHDLYSEILGNTPEIGIWRENFATSISRLETNYSGLDYLPGLARIPNSKPVEHTYSAYWGAARDRIPDSGHDLFERGTYSETKVPEIVPAGLGQHWKGTNYENMIHIRSGQWWENCGVEEAEAYESTLEPVLSQGLAYLWENSAETGTIGLRFLRNTNSSEGAPQKMNRKETCASGFFRSLKDLENWAERHPSHKKIYLGAIKHARVWGDQRKFRTWHEVSVLRAGEAGFEYLNCNPVTGAMRFVELDRVGGEVL